MHYKHNLERIDIYICKLKNSLSVRFHKTLHVKFIKKCIFWSLKSRKVRSHFTPNIFFSQCNEKIVKSIVLFCNCVINVQYKGSKHPNKKKIIKKCKLQDMGAWCVFKSVFEKKICTIKKKEKTCTSSNILWSTFQNFQSNLTKLHR